MHKLKTPLFSALSGIFLMALSGWMSMHMSYSPEALSQLVSSRAEQKLKSCTLALNTLNRFPDKSVQDSLLNFYEQENIALYRFRHDSLLFWNNARISPDWDKSQFEKPYGLLKLKSGFYLYSIQSRDSTYNLALCLIRPDFPIKNKYLNNAFESWTGIPAGLQLAKNGERSFPVLIGDQKLFSVRANEESYVSEHVCTFAALLFYFGLAALLLAALNKLPGSGALFYVSSLSGLLLLRISFTAFHWPGFLYKSSFYDVHDFGNATAWLNTYLGDLILNALYFLFLGVLLGRGSAGKNGHSVRYRILFNWIFSVLAYYQFNHSISNLVYNSTLNFDLLSIFNMKSLAFVALVVLALQAIALFLFLRNGIRYFNGPDMKGVWLYLLSVSLLILLHYMISTQRSMLSSSWILLPALILASFHRYGRLNLGYALITHLLLCSLFASYEFSRNIQLNQTAEFKLLAYRLSERQDPALESEYNGLSAKIQNDRRLQNLIALLPATQKEISLLLRQTYFSSYFDRYNTEFFLFGKDCYPLLNVDNPVYWNQGYFEDQILYHADSCTVAGLFFVGKHKDASLYLARIDLSGNTLFIRMEAKQLEEQGSFPDLLLDESLQKQEKLGNLSYAVYRSGHLVNHYGDFSYPHFPANGADFEKASVNYKHYRFEPEENTLVLISERTKSFTEIFTYNSYLFLIFSMTGFIVLYLKSILFSFEPVPTTLTQRIQSSIIFLLLLAMSAVGISSGRLVGVQFENDNKKDLAEKGAVAVNELLSQFSSAMLFDESQKELVNQKLIDYARLFNSDLSLFNAEGKLVNTSQPKLYELGLSSTLMHPRAFEELRHNLAFSSHVREWAGKLNYLSLYIPIYTSNNTLEGFINLPYFARQSSLTKELSGLISALINVYLVLFMLSIGSGLLLSGYITRPLRLIKQQMAGIGLGKRNESIHWPSQDEIGSLVSEYNQMLLKLEESAVLLAQSERESAWRDMAKQVAHEIKNPLTPMKLNLQYLQHLAKSHPEEFRQKFEKSSAGIIEQIDSLANIATEFSHLARLPGTRLEAINLVELLERAVQVFTKTESLQVRNTIAEREILVLGDKDQCLRVFNNLLSNAIQALEDIQEPFIEIHADLGPENVILSIRDNGCGIAEELKAVMFTPNFTTKNTGSGLGLVMVKNIMLGFGGRIWFESQKNEGSTFYLEFRRAKKSDL